MAKILEKFVKLVEPDLKDIEIGRIVYVRTSALRINRDLECFLDPIAPFEIQKSVFNTLRVKRAEDGFHVALLAPWQWTPGGRLAGWISVASFVEDYDPTVDVEAKGRSKG